MIQQRNDLGRLAAVIADFADSLVNGQAARDRRPARAFLARVLQDLGQQPRPVGDRASVGIGALVVPARQEVM